MAQEAKLKPRDAAQARAALLLPNLSRATVAEYQSDPNERTKPEVLFACGVPQPKGVAINAGDDRLFSQT